MEENKRVLDEYDRLKKLFESADQTRMQLLEGQLWEHARMRVQLDDLNAVVAQTGLVKVNPANPLQQKETMAARALVRLRANYINSAKLLARELGGDIEDMDDLEDFL